jgi:hypothetical protein
VFDTGSEAPRRLRRLSFQVPSVFRGSKARPSPWGAAVPVGVFKVLEPPQCSRDCGSWCLVLRSSWALRLDYL